MSLGWQLAFFALGLMTGWGFPIRRRRKAASASESPEESLRRLQHQPGARMGGGQVLMGPQQPRPQVQSRIPAAPPKGGGGVTPGVRHIRFDRPPGMPERGTSGGAGQARER